MVVFVCFVGYLQLRRLILSLLSFFNFLSIFHVHFLSSFPSSFIHVFLSFLSCSFSLFCSVFLHPFFFFFFFFLFFFFRYEGGGRYFANLTKTKIAFLRGLKLTFGVKFLAFTMNLIFFLSKIVRAHFPRGRYPPKE